jgi:hypothetical protein
MPSREVRTFNGPWPLLDPEAVPVENALAAQNVRYLPGQVATRYGHTPMVTPGDAITAMLNWLPLYNGANQNWLVYYATGTGIRFIDLQDIGAGATTLISQGTAQAAAMLGIGSRLYCGFRNLDGVGIAGGQVYDRASGAADPMFAAPIQAGFATSTEPGSGNVTAGVHRIGYLLQSRSGFTTAWCPVTPANAFSPFSFTASGGKTLRLSIGAFSFPAYAGLLQVIMTTAANLNRYYLVPGCTVHATNAGVTFPDINISDDDLAATGTDAAPYENRLTQDQSGNPPFEPAALFLYGERCGYITRDSFNFPVCYFSDSSDYQAVNAATSGVYLPGNLQQIAGFALRGVAYLLGPHWTYAVADNGGVPATWADAQLVDGAIGTLSPSGIALNASQGFAWVADEGGLYLFEGGVYPERPISYYQTPDWNRINWAYAGCVQVADDKNNKRVEVLAPLDGATSPTHRLTWDYTGGTDPETAKYSLQSLNGYAMGAIAVVANPQTRKQEIWLGPSSAGAILRQNDGSETNPYRDVDTAGTTAKAISALYESALLPGLDALRGQMHFFHGNHLRVRGAGSLALTIWGLDHLRSVVPAASPLSLAASPGAELLFKYFLQSEWASVQLSTNAVDAYFILSALKQYYTVAAPQR